MSSSHFDFFLGISCSHSAMWNGKGYLMVQYMDHEHEKQEEGKFDFFVIMIFVMSKTE